MKEAGIPYRAIYKNTTIDPPGTIKHAKEMGAEVLMPKDGVTFFRLVQRMGFPNRFQRFCCGYLKEYKVLDKAVVGIRKSESVKRSKLYNEPEQCRVYSKTQKVRQYYPILDWTDSDVKEFIEDRKITCAPVYYDNEGVFHVERRLGCMACPLKYEKKRVQDFKDNPKFLIAWLKAGQKWLDAHPNAKSNAKYKNIYERFVRDLMFRSQKSWEDWKSGVLGDVDCKQFIEDYFKIKL